MLAPIHSFIGRHLTAKRSLRKPFSCMKRRNLSFKRGVGRESSKQPGKAHAPISSIQDPCFALLAAIRRISYLYTNSWLYCHVMRARRALKPRFAFPNSTAG